MESTGQNVEQESPNELLRRERHSFLLIVVTIVLPLKLNLTVFDVHQAVVGDGHAMSVAAHVVEHLLGSGKRRLGIDHPFDTLRSGDQAGEGARLAKRLQGTKELQVPGIERFLKRLQKAAAEQAGQNPNRQEEVRLAGHPPLPIG